MDMLTFTLSIGIPLLLQIIKKVDSEAVFLGKLAASFKGLFGFNRGFLR